MFKTLDFRQALKERLRASSQSQSLTPPGSGNKKIIVKKEIIPQIKSPVLTPVKWLTPRKRKKMFGRPKIRSEKRKILDFDNNKLNVIKEESNNNSNQRLLGSLSSTLLDIQYFESRKKDSDGRTSLNWVQTRSGQMPDFVVKWCFLIRF